MATNRRFLTRIAISMGAAAALPIVALCGAGVSQAQPPYPSAPKCSSWKFDGFTELALSNGWMISFTSYGTKASGAVRGVRGGPDVPLTGTIKGSIGGGGRDISMHIDWRGYLTAKGNPVGYGTVDFQGRVNASGYAYGDAQGKADTREAATWKTTHPLLCASQ
jgi:hypothetical protein